MASSIWDFTITEAVESGSGSIQKDGSIQRIYYVKNWTDLPAFMSVLVQSWQTVGIAWNYWPGHRDPDFPAYYCQSATFQSMGMPSFDMSTKRTSWAEGAKVTATYKVPTFDPTDPTDIMEESLDFSAEELSLPAGMFKKTGSDDVIPGQQRVIIPVCAYSLTLIDVPTLPGGNANLIWSLMGKLNSSSFKGAATKLVLFLGAQTDRTTTSQGTKGWKIQLKFLVRPPGFEWTKVFTAKDGSMVAIETKVGGQPLYATGNLNSLLP